MMASSTVFPTRVGVNRRRRMQHEDWLRFPHTRGGEPFGVDGSTVRRAVFPTRVGVNRRLVASAPTQRRFPHTRGGEPFWLYTKNDLKLFSPHAWG